MATIAKYHLKLNPEKCVFGVEAGKFFGFLFTERGIEAKPDLGERGAAIDRAVGRPVQIRICWSGQGPPLLPVFEEE